MLAVHSYSNPMAHFTDTVDGFRDIDDGMSSSNVRNDDGIHDSDAVDSLLDEPNESIVDEFNSHNNTYTTDSTQDENMNIIQKLRYWWYHKRINSSQYRNNTLQERGIALYELDDQGNPVEVGFNKNSDSSDNNFEPIPLPDYNSLRRRFKSNFERRNLNFIRWCIFISLISAVIIYLLVHILSHNKSGKSKYGKNKLFNPLKRFNNGTHDFNAMNIIINIRSLSPSLITLNNTPFLYSLYYENNNNAENDTMVSELIPNFPYNSITQDWCMVTGQLPKNHGIINDQFWFDGNNLPIWTNTNNTLNLSKPIWTEINDAYDRLANDKFTISSFGWNNYISDNITYMIDESNNKKKLTKTNDKFNEIINIIDHENLTMRPQLNFITIDELNNYFNSVEWGKFKNYPMDMNNILSEIDKNIRKFFYQLRHRNMQNFTNVAIVSDLGNNNMNLQTNRTKLIKLKDILGKDDYYKKIDHITEYDQKNHIIPISIISLRISNPTHKNEIYKMLKKSLNPNQVRLFVKDKLPVEFNMTHSISDKIQKRLDDIWLISQNGYKIILDNDKINLNRQLYFIDGETSANIDGMNITSPYPLKNLDNIRSIFIGKGPYFKDQFVINNHYGKNKNMKGINRYHSMNNIAIYDMITELVGLNLKDQKIDKDFYAKTIMNPEEYDKYMIEAKTRAKYQSQSHGNLIDIEDEDVEPINEDITDIDSIGSFIVTMHSTTPTESYEGHKTGTRRTFAQTEKSISRSGTSTSLANVHTRTGKDKPTSRSTTRLSHSTTSRHVSNHNNNWDYDYSNWLSVAHDTGEQIIDAGENLLDEISHWWNNLIDSD